MENDVKIFTFKKKILNELIDNQLKNIQINKKLNYKDLCRITKYIDSSIFDPEKCCYWKGYVTSEIKTNRCTYINFFYRNKKVALHRLLYENFISSLGIDFYVKFSCNAESHLNKKCCNVNHMVKYKYNHTEHSENNEHKKNNKNTKPIDLIIVFD